MEKQQTAVDWLVEKLKSQGLLIGDKLVAVREAKEMEKQQMENADKNGAARTQYEYELVHGGSEYWDEAPQEFESYYNETFKP